MKISYEDIKPGDLVQARSAGVAYVGRVAELDPGAAFTTEGGLVAMRSDEEIVLIDRPAEASPTVPTVGRIVQFRARTKGVVSAATIIRTRESTVEEGLEGWERKYPKGLVRELKGSTVDLLVHGLTGDYREYAVPYSTHPSKRTWGWPEKS